MPSSRLRALTERSGDVEDTSHPSKGISIWNAPAAGSKAGGDWCDAVDISSEVVAITIGDVAGHGDLAADTMEAVRDAVLTALATNRIPSDVLAEANRCVRARVDEPIVTAIVAFYDRARRTLTYANAGHPHPLVVVGSSASFLVPIRADMPLGVYDRHGAQNYSIALPPRSLLVLYTDGVTERERDPIRGERELAGAALAAYGLEGKDYARAVAESLFALGNGYDDSAIAALHTASAALRRARDERGHASL